ncbi:Gfo/Idh/MocA family protein [Paenibacillus chartarius]|uniref:Gfo/Idh/MocA family protein n=1 Tax=Paenibacillus chartarius TaxID=747481 RepID=A0ABV6DSD4_9BACL
MRKHRFIIIGHGNISRSYMSAFAKLERAEIVGVVGRTEEKVKLFAETHRLRFYGTDLAKVAAEAEATAVIICTPNAAHYGHVLAAAELGLHCLCEKPLHIDPAKQQEMIRRCSEHNVRLGVSYMRRFIPHIEWLKELMESGKLGRITVADVTMKHFRAKAYYDSWHGTYEQDGGGPFMQQGSHLIDMVQWLCGGAQEVLDAKLFQVYHDIETEDHGYAVIRYRNGAVGMIQASTASVGMEQERIEISGTLGSVSADYKGFLTFEVPGVEKPDFDPASAHNDVLFVKLAEDFLAAIEQERPPAISGEEAAKATDLIHQIYMKSGKPLKLF